MEPVPNQTEANPLVERNVKTIKEVEALLERQKEEVRTMLEGQNKEILAIQEQTAERVRDLLYNRYQADIHKPTPIPEDAESPLPGAGITPPEEATKDALFNHIYETLPSRQKQEKPSVEDDNPQKVVRETTPANDTNTPESQNWNSLYGETGEKQKEQEMIREEERIWHEYWKARKEGRRVALSSEITESPRFRNYLIFGEERYSHLTPEIVRNEDRKDIIYPFGKSQSKIFFDLYAFQNSYGTNNAQMDNPDRDTIFKYYNPETNDPPLYLLFRVRNLSKIVQTINTYDPNSAEDETNWG